MRQQFFLIFNRISDTWRLIFENLRNFEKILLHKNLQNSSAFLKITITWRLIFENLQNSSALLKITITIIFRFHFINVAEIFKILKKKFIAKSYNQYRESWIEKKKF